MAQECFQLIQARGPETFIVAKPSVGDAQRAGVQVANVGSAEHLARYQAGALQCLDVLGGSRQRHGERLGQLTDRLLALRESTKHQPTRGVAQCVKDRVQP
jgi:hypothetical protein